MIYQFHSSPSLSSLSLSISLSFSLTLKLKNSDLISLHVQFPSHWSKGGASKLWFLKVVFDVVKVMISQHFGRCSLGLSLQIHSWLALFNLSLKIVLFSCLLGLRKIVAKEVLFSFLSFGKNEEISFKIPMNFIGYFVHEVIFGANIFYLGFCFCSCYFSFCGGVGSCAFSELHFLLFW